MKKLITLFALICLPFLGIGQVIDLKLEHFEKQKEKERKAAKTHMVIGGVLSAVGLGTAIVGPLMLSEPVDPTASYLHELKAAGNNTYAQNKITQKYQSEIDDYVNKLERNERTKDAMIIGGAASFSVGVGFIVGGAIKLSNNK